MALVNCPECNGAVSTSAKTCPKCNFKTEKSSTYKTLAWVVLICGLLTLPIGVGIIGIIGGIIALSIRPSFGEYVEGLETPEKREKKDEEGED